MHDLFPRRHGHGRRHRNRRFLSDPFFESPFKTVADFDVDIEEDEEAYTLEADLPGLTKEDIHLDYTDNVLSIQAQQETEREEQDDERNYIRRERSTRSYNRQFLIKNVDEEAIDAKFTNGVLTVKLPKKDKDADSTNRIEIE